MNGLLQALPIIAAVIGRKLGVSVVYGASEASTDGETIYLPTLGEDQRAVVYGLGYTVHESSHLRLTDLDLSLKGALQTVTNILEDGRCEVQMSQLYPGMKYHLDAMNLALVEDDLNNPADDTDDDGTLVEKLLMYRLYADAQGLIGYAEMADGAEALARGRFSDSVITRIRGVLGSVPQLKSTGEVVALAGHIVELLEEASKPPESPPGVGDTGVGKGDSPGVDAGVAQGEGEKDQSLEGNADAPGPAEPNERQRSALSEALSQLENGTVSDTQSKIEGILSQLADKAEARRSHAGRGFASSAVEDVRPNPAEIQRLRGTSRRLMVPLSTLLEAQASVGFKRGRYGLELDPRVVYRSALGDPNVFRQRHEVEARDTAVLLLIDRSSSMGSQNAYRVAAEAAYALADTITLSDTDSAVSACVFPGHDRAIDVLTAFGDRVQSTVGYYFGLQPSGGTPMLSALVDALTRLEAQPQSKKVLFVLTDGEADQPKACARLLNQASIQGIRSVGLGINTDSLGTLIPGAQQISNIEDLPAMMTKITRQALLPAA